VDELKNNTGEYEITTAVYSCMSCQQSSSLSRLLTKYRRIH